MTLQLHPAVVATATDTGMVLLDRQAGRYFELNATGATVVRCLTDGTDPVLELVEHNHVPESQATRDVQAFLEALTSRGLAVTR